MEVTGKIKVRKSAKGAYYTSLRKKAPEGSEKQFDYAPIGINFIGKDIDIEDGTWINVKNGFLSFYKVNVQDEEAEEPKEEIRILLVVMEFEDAPKEVKQETGFGLNPIEDDDLPF